MDSIEANVEHNGDTFAVSLPKDTFILPDIPYRVLCADGECTRYETIQYTTRYETSQTLTAFLKSRPPTPPTIEVRPPPRDEDTRGKIEHMATKRYKPVVNILATEPKNVRDLDYLKIQLKAAITWLHRHQFFHHDLHGDNVLVKPDTLRIYIIDWDLLKYGAPKDTPDTGSDIEQLERCITGRKASLGFGSAFPDNCIKVLFEKEQDGGKRKQYLVYDGHRYLIRKEGRRQFIMHKKSVLYLSAIRGQYARIK